MSLINILINVDGSKLAQQVGDGSISAGSQSSPTNLGSYTSSNVYIAMVAQNSVASNNQGQSELTVTANSGDSLRWSMQTFDGNADYTAFLYQGTFNPNQSITPLNYFNMHTSTYLPAGTQPTTGAILFHNNTYVAMGTVIEPGKQIQYTLAFELINNSTGQTIGFFTWDPFISVSN